MKRSKPTSSSRILKALRHKRQTLAELRALQRLMANAVMRPLDESSRIRAEWSDGRATKKVVEAFIKPNKRLTSLERLEIYNRQYWFRVMDCFAEDFAGVRAVLGEKQFYDFAVAYLSNHPSQSFTLRNLGSRLIEFMQAEPRWTAPRNAMALDMARLEWAHIESFDNAAKPPLTAEDLQGREPADIHLRLQPFITLLQLAHPFDDFLIRLRENSRLRGEASNAIEDDSKLPAARSPRLPRRQTIHLAVHRFKNVVHYKRLQSAQYELLFAIQKGASLEQALETLPTTGRMPRIGSWFQNWSALGWFW